MSAWKLWQPCAHRRDDVAGRRQDPEHGEAATVHGGLSVNEHREPAVRSSLHFYLDAKLATQVCRHTDGVQGCQSIRTVTDGNLRHGSSVNRRWVLEVDSDRARLRR
jgi:hypothetical protein